MKKVIIDTLLIEGGIFLSLISYQLEFSQKEVKIMTQKVEVIKYVEKKKAAIYSKPNASRSELLVLMRTGSL